MTFFQVYSKSNAIHETVINDGFIICNVRSFAYYKRPDIDV